MPGSLINKTAQEKQEHLSRDDFYQNKFGVFSHVLSCVCARIFCTEESMSAFGKKYFKNDFGLLLHEVQAGPFAKIQIEYMIMCVCVASLHTNYCSLLAVFVTLRKCVCVCVCVCASSLGAG